MESGDSSEVEPLLLHVSDKVIRSAASLLPANHAAALLAVAVLHMHARPGGNAKLVVAVRALLLSVPGALMDNEGGLSKPCTFETLDPRILKFSRSRPS